MLIYFKEKNCPISFYLIIWRKRNVFAGPVEVKGWCWRLVDKNRRKKKKHYQGHAREREARILVSNLLYNSLVIVWTGMVNNWEQWPAPPPVWWLSFSVLGFLIMDCISRRLWASCKATKTRDVFLYEVYRIHVTLAHGRKREREREREREESSRLLRSHQWGFLVLKRKATADLSISDLLKQAKAC